MRALKYLILFLSVALTSCVNEPEGENVDTGSQAPDFEVDVYADGSFYSARPTTLSSMKGSPVILVFFNTSCPDCQEELATVQRLYDRYSAEIRFLCVARSENKESVEAYWTDHRLTIPVAPQSDATVYHLYAESVIPRTYVLNADGVIVASFSDSPVADFDTLARIVAAFRQ